MENREYKRIRPMDSTEALNRGYKVPEGIGMYNKINGWEIKYRGGDFSWIPFDYEDKNK